MKMKITRFKNLECEQKKKIPLEDIKQKFMDFA